MISPFGLNLSPFGLNLSRLAVFLFVCVVVRLGFAYVAYVTPIKLLPLMAFPAATMALGFLINFVRARRVGAFGGNAWWHPLRLVHALVFACFAALAASRNRNAWVLLVLDVAVGLTGRVVAEGGAAKLGAPDGLGP